MKLEEGAVASLEEGELVSLATMLQVLVPEGRYVVVEMKVVCYKLAKGKW